MYRRHLLALGTLGTAENGVLYDVPDGAGGGGAVAPATDGAPDGGGADPTAGDGGGDPGAPLADGADDDDADPLDTTELADHLPEANVRTQLRRAQRFAQRARPIVDRFRDASGKFLPTEHVDRILYNAREFEAVDRVLRNSPRAMETLLSEQRRLDGLGGPALDAAAAAQDEDRPFDESKHPFERDTEQGQYLFELAKQNHDLARQVRHLSKGFQQFSQQSQQQTLVQLNEQWKGVTLSAAQELPEEVRPIFIRGVRREFDRLANAKQLHRTDPRAIIEAELREFRAARGARRPAVTPQTSRQSAMVAGNQLLPRVPRPGSTSPASPAPKPAHTETLRDARASFFRRTGKG